jgi:hypothetical protein
MTVVASTLIAKNDPIGSIDDLWEPSALFLPNWNQDVKLGTAYRGVVQSSRDVSEQRLLLAKKPRRVLSYALRSYDAADTERARAALTRMSSARVPMPLWTDGAQLTGKPDMGVTAYTGDFTDKRFQVGGRVCALREDDAGISTEFKYAKITSISDTTITLDSDLDEVYTTPPSIHSHAHTDFISFSPTTTWNTPKAAAYEGEPIIASVFSGGASTAVLSSATLRNLGTGETWDVSSDVFHDESGTWQEGGFVNATTLVTLAPENGHFIVTFVLTNPVTQAATSITSVSGAHATDPIHQTVSEPNASANGRDVEVDISPDLANQLVVFNVLAGLTNIATFTTTTPGGVPTYLEGAFGGVNVDQQGGVLEYVIPSPGAVTVGAVLPKGESDEEYGFFAAAVVLNPAESGGFDRDYIYPVIECDLELGNKASAITDAVNGAQLSLVETPGASALDPEVIPGDTPPGATLYPPVTGYPIMELPIDWNGVEVGHYRVGKRDISGITTVLQAFGSRAGNTFKLPFVSLDRHESWSILEFFDSRGGRAFPFWLLTPSPVLTASAITAPPSASKVTLPGNINEQDWDQYTHLGAYDKTLDSLSIHEITVSIAVGDNHDLTISPALPDTDETRYEFKTAHLCRFDKEAYEESWITDEAPRTALPVKELINEQVVAVDLVDLCGVGGGDPWTPNNDWDLCEDVRCGSDDPDECCMCGIYGVSVAANCFIGECITGVCDEGCVPNGGCSTYLEYVSCIAGVMRWEHPVYDIWVELDTGSVDWTFDITDWLTSVDCCDTVDQGLDLCACQMFDNCGGIVHITTETCSYYRRDSACNRFIGPCTYVTTLLISTEGGGPGNEFCA